MKRGPSRGKPLGQWRHTHLASYNNDALKKDKQRRHAVVNKLTDLLASPYERNETMAVAVMIVTEHWGMSHSPEKQSTPGIEGG